MTDWHARKHACTLLLNMCVRHMKHLGRACVALQVATRVKQGRWHAPRRPRPTTADDFAVMHPWLSRLFTAIGVRSSTSTYSHPTLLTAGRTDPCPGHPVRGQYYAGSPSKVKSIHANRLIDFVNHQREKQTGPFWPKLTVGTHELPKVQASKP